MWPWVICLIQWTCVFLFHPWNMVWFPIKTDLYAHESLCVMSRTWELGKRKMLPVLIGHPQGIGKRATLEWGMWNFRDMLCVEMQCWTLISHCEEVLLSTLYGLTQIAQHSCSHSAGVKNILKVPASGALGCLQLPSGQTQSTQTSWQSATLGRCIGMKTECFASGWQI